jgi:hypothetical protein
MNTMNVNSSKMYQLFLNDHAFNTTMTLDLTKQIIRHTLFSSMMQ